ncbi:nucleotide sugar dehydrogenase [Aspergillus neoniger CBS 115656]|uniref:UDP-glucose 6-dehydrogenase n=1 Tax=Aspergillus neoniger (strain CBS 115656) TaxID=1448310 RepID=A0A318ZG68_ASPNB|nr:nucleotide sugar dehydrogenase [Aspergillus neoniger CBS 115656]PYH35072.1 nucleotide sugar dehydrogenase [Aspergillus neoniger CBS 115656]
MKSDSMENRSSQWPEGSIQTVCMIGAGYVGTLTAIALASKNPHVHFSVVDKDASLIAAWNSDHTPIFEPGLEDILFEDGQIQEKALFVLSHGYEGRRRRLANITFSSDINTHISDANIIFICVDTPSEVYFPDSDEIRGLDLKNLESAIKSIAQLFTRHKVIVQKSTAPSGICQWIKKTLRDAAPPTASFDIISSPEFLAQGTAMQDLLNPNRVVVGYEPAADGAVPESVKALIRLYTPWVPQERIVTTDTWSSELAKIASNALIAQRISSINSLSAVCEATGASITELSRIAGLDPRIGPQCLRAGFGFGGSCLRKDVCCLIYLARELGLDDVAEYWRGVIQINDSQSARITRRIMSFLPPIVPDTKTKAAILGFSFKKNTTDIRNTTAIKLVRDLVGRGLRVNIFDPYVPRQRIEKSLMLQCGAAHVNTAVVDSTEAACEGCSVIVLHTDWDEFVGNSVDWKYIVAQMREPRLFLGPPGSFNVQTMKQYGLTVLEVGKP